MIKHIISKIVIIVIVILAMVATITDNLNTILFCIFIILCYQNEISEIYKSNKEKDINKNNEE